MWVYKFLSIFAILLVTNDLVKAKNSDIKRNCPVGKKLKNDPNLADIQDFPFIVNLRVVHNKFLLCAGSLISEKWVVTAAHCLNLNSPIIVQLGRFYEYYICPDNHTVTQIVPPENYIFHNHHGERREPYPSDFALVKLVEPVQFNSFIHPVLLPRRNHPMYDEVVLIIGWALTGYQAPYLQKMELMTYDQWGCNGVTAPETWSGESTLPRSGRNILQVCVKAKSSDDDSTCVDNSGGPLILKTTGELIGVLNFGNECPDDVMERKSYYAKVIDFLDWIEENTGVTREKQILRGFFKTGEKLIDGRERSLKGTWRKLIRGSKKNN